MIAAIALLLALQAGPELKRHVEAGLNAKRAGDYDAAIREFQRVAELAPRLAAAHVNLGAVYFEKKDYASAIPPLRRAIELNPDLPGAHGMLGTALLAQGFASESIVHLEKGASDELLGVALLDAGRTRDAVDKLEAALVKRPADPDLLYYLGQAHARLSRQLFENLSEAHPESARTRQMLGEARAATGNRDAAEKEFRAALTLRPELRGVHLALGELALESGDFESAKREFGEEARLAPGSAEAAYRLGYVLMQLGRAAEARAELERSVRLRPGMPEALLELGKAEAALGGKEKAESLFQKVVEMERSSAVAESAHFQLSEIYRSLGRAGDAERELKRFQQLRRSRK